MRVAFLTAEYVTEQNFSGGLANYIHRLSLALVRMGHRPLVVIPSDRDETFRHDGVEVHRVQERGLGRYTEIVNRLTRGRYYSLLYYLCRSRTLRKKIEALHAQEPIAIAQYPHLGGLGIFRPRRIPTVVRLSSYAPLWKLHGEYDSMDRRVLRDQILLEDIGLRRADAVFGPSGAVAAVVERDIGKPVAVIETPFLMDAEETDDSTYREKMSGKEYILYVGRFSIAKGFITLADAAPALLETYPRLHIAIAGREMGGYKGAPAMDYLRKNAGRHADRILFLGDMRHDKLYPVMAHARAVVIPSLVENFPNVCLEAMAHRCLVIATRGTTFEQLLADGESGILFEPGSPAGLAEAVEKALQLPDAEWAKMGEKAAERIRGLRPEVTVERLLAFYREVIGRAGGRKGDG